MEERFEMFTVLISKLNRSIKKIKTEEMKEYNLKSPHVSCLYYIYKMGDITATNLCDVCGEDKASVSRALEQLEEQGFIECEVSVKKKYNSKLWLTESGKMLAEKIAKKIDNILELASSKLDEASRKQMYRALEIIDGVLENICKTYGGEK